jgi:hypothetical protein
VSISAGVASPPVARALSQSSPEPSPSCQSTQVDVERLVAKGVDSASRRAHSTA